jgi:uncharacterized small protein (DUF1192 family)
VNNRQTEVNRLVEEAQRLELAIAQAQEQFRNTSITSQDELQQRIAANDNQIATIDSQLTKTILETTTACKSSTVRSPSFSKLSPIKSCAPR